MALSAMQNAARGWWGERGGHEDEKEAERAFVLCVLSAQVLHASDTITHMENITSHRPFHTHWVSMSAATVQNADKVIILQNVFKNKYIIHI